MERVRNKEYVFKNVDTMFTIQSLPIVFIQIIFNFCSGKDGNHFACTTSYIAACRRHPVAWKYVDCVTSQCDDVYTNQAFRWAKSYNKIALKDHDWFNNLSLPNMVSTNVILSLLDNKENDTVDQRIETFPGRWPNVEQLEFELVRNGTFEKRFVQQVKFPAFQNLLKVDVRLFTSCPEVLKNLLNSYAQLKELVTRFDPCEFLFLQSNENELFSYPALQTISVDIPRTISQQSGWENIRDLFQNLKTLEIKDDREYYFYSNSYVKDSIDLKQLVVGQKVTNLKINGSICNTLYAPFLNIQNLSINVRSASDVEGQGWQYCMDPLYNLLTNMPNLTQLNLSEIIFFDELGYDIWSQSLYELGLSIGRCSKLKKLTLSMDSIHCIGFEQIMKGMIHKDSCAILDHLAVYAKHNTLPKVFESLEMIFDSQITMQLKIFESNLVGLQLAGLKLPAECEFQCV